VYARGAGAPNPQDLERAAGILNGGSRTAILAGRGALKATDELLAVADVLGAPIAKAVLGKAAVPDDHPLVTGSIGLLGTTASRVLMEECDTLLIAGSTMPYIEHYPKPGQARGVQIDNDPARIGLRYPVETGVVGDCKRALTDLLPLLRRRDDRSFADRIGRAIADWRNSQHPRETSADTPMKPQLFAAEIGRRLADDAIVSVDSGTITAWWARHIAARGSQMHSVSGTMASMGCALPYAIAAQLAYPDRQCIAIAGDGGMSMLMAELATCVMYKLPVKVFVFRNNTLGQIKWEQVLFLGNPEFGCDLQPIDFAAVARACGAAGYSLRDPKRCGAVVEEALAHPGPVVVDAEIDPLEAPMFANFTEEQAKKLREALSKGEKDSEGILANARENRARELV
jgi:pyruvate dehydrogenase (quinone)/pyruvate oxidase